MRFSNVDVIQKEMILNHNRKHVKDMGFLDRFFYKLRSRKEPEYTFSFYTPKDIYFRACSFCHDVEDELDEEFHISDLANALYLDFYEHIQKTNDIHDTYRRLQARGINPTKIKPYSTEDVYEGVIFEEVRGFEIVETKIEHKRALRGEYLLEDMLTSYPEHGYILENILEIVFYDFINDYRRSLIKNPVKKILQYY